jgi:HK97 gp10 family phage protein
MKQFNNIGDFLGHLATVAAHQNVALHRGLERCAQLMERTAKAEIGVYQSEIGDFPGWVELADATKAERVQQGYTENDPLLRSGSLRDSISHEIEGDTAAVGSTSDVMVYQELGTERIPPRPVLGPAALRNKEKIQRILGHAVAEGLLYGSGETLTSLD